MSRLPLEELLKERPLAKEVVCANCWHAFPPEQALWVAVHQSLRGDPQLPRTAAGEEAQRRFVAERFDPEGRALDAEGSPSTQLACPRCHLSIPRASLEMPNVVLSILGSPGSGKSVFLTAMTFAMRQQAARFGLRFQDADLALNDVLITDERKMFHDANPKIYRPIRETIQKTQELGARYRESILDGHTAKYVSPFVFLLGPAGAGQDARRAARLISLYDNAGEHFQSGRDRADTPMTRHLAASEGLMYVFDPTKDRRVREAVNDAEAAGTTGERQDTVLTEAVNRVREHANIPQVARINQPIVVVLTKFDVWRGLLGSVSLEKVFRTEAATGQLVLNWAWVNDISARCKEMLGRLCPDIVNTAEASSKTVIYVPVAAAGWDVRKDPTTGHPAFRLSGQDQDVTGVLIPLLALLSRSLPRLVRSVER